MRKLVILALFGMAAQLVDGGLGMAYGLTSSTLLLAFGLAPAVASASVHLAEVGTTLASGLAHHKLGNTDWRTVRWLAVPGAIGAFSGAVLLSNLHADAARPFIAVFLSVLGLYLLVRFAFLGGAITLREGSVSTKVLAPLGMGAGFLDAVGGGGWGPISTPTLMASGKMQPRKVIGTVDTSEFAVSAAASIGFLAGLGAAGINWFFALALLAGGVVAAPLAAYLVKVAPAHLLGVAVGGVILLTNVRTIFRTYDVADPIRIIAYAAILLVSLAGLYVAILRARRRAAAEAVDSTARVPEASRA